MLLNGRERKRVFEMNNYNNKSQRVALSYTVSTDEIEETAIEL